MPVRLLLGPPDKEPEEEEKVEVWEAQTETTVPIKEEEPVKEEEPPVEEEKPAEEEQAPAESIGEPQVVRKVRIVAD